MIRLGLCCIFKEQPIHFRIVTAANLKKRQSKGEDPFLYLSELILDNSRALKQAISFCASHHIGCFRVNSQFFPLCTHPDFCYRLDQLPEGKNILNLLTECRTLASQHGIRLVLHPDQFVVLNSPSEKVVESSIKELAYHATLAESIGVDVINIHGGGVYGDKQSALNRLRETIQQLPANIRNKLTLENDDKSYTPADLLPVCQDLAIPFVYDAHHHRCLPDALSLEEVTQKAIETWNREPLFHLSSPLEGWKGPQPYRHHDYIDIEDFPCYWQQVPQLTVEVEAKAKELAVIKLYQELQKRRVSLFEPIK